MVVVFFLFRCKSDLLSVRAIILLYYSSVKVRIWRELLRFFESVTLARVQLHLGVVICLQFAIKCSSLTKLAVNDNYVTVRAYRYAQHCV